LTKPTTAQKQEPGKPTEEPYSTYRLVQSRREGAKVRQIALLNLGPNFDVGREYWSLLCSRIEGILAGQGDLFSIQKILSEDGI